MSSFGYGDDWPEPWKLAVETESKRLKLEAVREWPKGLCWKCKHLKSATIEYHSWRDCIIGTGPPRTECAKFEAIPA